MEIATCYLINDSNDSLDDFIKVHSALVFKIATKLKSKLPKHIQIEDLIQAGLIGLLEARNRYQVDKGASFATFASIRIHGAMVDEIRRNSWVSRDSYDTNKKISIAISHCEKKLGRKPMPTEIADHMGMDLEEYYDLSDNISLVSINLEAIENELSTDSKNGCYQEIASEELNALMQEHISKLSKREQQILSLYYIEELSFNEIAQIYHLTEARISQIHRQTILWLRAQMQQEDL
jgi:RNA polymerase sigma factor for flagellar operon FliA